MRQIEQASNVITVNRWRGITIVQHWPTTPYERTYTSFFKNQTKQDGRGCVVIGVSLQYFILYC